MEKEVSLFQAKPKQEPPNIQNNITIYISFILVWIAVTLWTRFIDNFLFNTLGIDPKSSVASFVIAMVISFLIIYFFFSEIK